MKTRILTLIGLVWILSTSAMAQYIVSVKDNKVEIRDLKGKYITSNYYSKLKDAIGGTEIVVLWFESGKVEVRDYKLKYITSQYYSGLKEVRTSGNDAVLYYKSGKIEVRDEKLKYVSSRWQ
jgi:hypothetical protein